MRSFGGTAKIKEPDTELPKSGETVIRFSRPIVYPRELMAEFDPGY